MQLLVQGRHTGGKPCSAFCDNLYDGEHTQVLYAMYTGSMNNSGITVETRGWQTTPTDNGTNVRVST